MSFARQIGFLVGMPLETSTPLSRRIADALDCRPQEGVYRVSREIFRDPELFDLEMEIISEERK